MYEINNILGLMVYVLLVLGIIFYFVGVNKLVVECTHQMSNMSQVLLRVC